jgi:hypothetical protein
MEDYKPIGTPIQTIFMLSKDDESKDADERLYKSMIDNLLYVTTSRPDVIQEVGHVVIFQATPRNTFYVSRENI